jgi:glycosyltransferase involved in cell wall biosynthesis
MGQMALWRRWRGQFTRVVANSEATRAALESDGFEGVSVIPCGVPRVPRRGERAAAPTAIFAGRLTRQKGLHVLLAAWPSVLRALPSARLLIAGDGPERARLERAAPAGVAFVGHLPQADLGPLLDSAWVLVVPSVGFEPFGMIAAEAMMRGVAVVASRVGGLAEVVDPGVTGSLVPPNDEGALGAALVAMLRDRALCERMGERGRTRAEERFSDDAYVGRFVALYEAMLARAGAVR